MVMQFSQLIRDLPTVATGGNLENDVRGIAYDSRRVSPGDLFVALRGEHTDGHRYISQAFERGAVAALVEEPVEAPCWAQVEDTLRALAITAKRLHGDPAADLSLVGVTGTNGKTTTTYIIEQIAAAAGVKMGLLGTIEYRWPGHRENAPHTTPFSSDLHGKLADMRKSGVTSAVLEVSSHALDLHRVDTLRFDVGVFTNLTRDHLDFHGTMENYAASKLRLFTDYLKPGGRAVLNMDDEWGRRYLHHLDRHQVITFGFSAEAQVRPEGDIEPDPTGINQVLWTPAGHLLVDSNLIGRHNLMNIMAAVAACLGLRMEPSRIEAGLQQPMRVPGRLERVDAGQPFTVVVDYAHTPDGVEKVISALSEFRPPHLITVVGCGGDRDRKKRPMMAGIAQNLSSLVILTSDNPRTEDPERILDEMEAGMLGNRGASYLRLADRREAIHKAIAVAGKGDIVLIAGKGHETYQEIQGVRHPFDDREVALEALAARGHARGKA